jgi:steroid 5-alpha reductase family enzyme
MTSQRLLNFILIFAAASAVAHHVVWILLERSGVNIWVDVWPMFVGDAIGALLMLYCFKLLLSKLQPR